MSSLTVNSLLKPSSTTTSFTRPLSEYVWFSNVFAQGTRKFLIRADLHPILEYCFPVWSRHNEQLMTKVERFRKYFLKPLQNFSTALQKQTSATRTQDSWTSTPHPQFMPLQNNSQFRSLHHSRLISWFQIISNTRPDHALRLRHEKWSTTDKATFRRQSNRQTLAFFAPEITSSAALTRFQSCLSSSDLGELFVIKMISNLSQKSSTNFPALFIYEQVKQMTRNDKMITTSLNWIATSVTSLLKITAVYFPMSVSFSVYTGNTTGEC